MLALKAILKLKSYGRKARRTKKGGAAFAPLVVVLSFLIICFSIVHFGIEGKNQMRKLFSLVFVFALVMAPLTGCGRGPEEAKEGEGEEGMDDPTNFEDAAKIEGEGAP